MRRWAKPKIKERTWEIIQDNNGRPLGRYYSEQREGTKEEIEIIKQFLIRINGGHMGKKTEQSNNGDRCNIVALAGIVKSINMKPDDGSGWVLIDTEMKDNKFIPCTVFASRELARMLSGFEKEDLLQVKGYVRAWSKKSGEEWVNRLEVRITEVKNKPPQRAKAATARQIDDDDIPF